MGVLAILLAAMAGFATGSVWYGFFGRRWSVAVGRAEAEVRTRRSKLPYAVAAAAMLVVATMMRHVFAASGISTGEAGLVAGFGIGAFLVLPWVLTSYAFAKRPRDLWWIDGGHMVLACTLMGMVLGFMG